IGPAQVQAAAQEPLVFRDTLGQPEIAGIVPEVSHAEMLHGDDPGGVDILIVDACVDGLGLGAGPSTGCGPARTGRGLDLGRADDPRRAQQLVGLGEDAEGPILAAGVRMVFLGLLPVGVANLLQRRLGRDAQDLERIDLETEQRHFARLPAAAARARAWLNGAGPTARWITGSADTMPARRSAPRPPARSRGASGGTPAGAG